MLPELLQSPFTTPVLDFAWTQFVTMAWVLIRLGVVFFLFVEILKRLPKSNRHNFKLAHTKRPFFNREFASELMWPMFNWIFLIPLNLLATVVVVGAILEAYAPKHSLQYLVEDLPFWIQVLLGTIVLDLALYIRHRFVHHFAWPYHTVHHSAKEITWLTWIRLHPGDVFIMGVINTIVLWFVGFEATAMVTAQIIMNHANRFNHSNIQLDFGFPLRYIFVSPNMHRWHHATDEEARNTNFCIVWAWIDVLFRSYYVPPYQLPEEYGVLDENGDDVVSATNWIEQMLYPFRVHLSTIRSALTRLRNEV